ncbi:hypothetical protein GF312_07610 [Candidatus Poribacteria bacterium]|nr:hypothetical protein [Candidatus Poribacteria bacterium]
MNISNFLKTILIIVLAGFTGCSRKSSRFITSDMRENAQKNTGRYNWAKRIADRMLIQARYWVEMSDDELWDMITSQELPRDIHTNKEYGCPNCKDGIVPYGNYPWKTDFWDRPWKIECPNCGEVYPKNDFYAFYKTALDKHGMFRRELGDRSLLFNAEHPDPSDPLHKIYVDDGYGMIDENGDKHRAIAYYTQWGHWRTIYTGLTALARAYTMTSDKVYAHKAAILLDRIADVYPDMDFMPLHKLGFEHSHGGSGKGRIEGCIWETRLATMMAYAYDYIYDAILDDGELVNFCMQKSEKYELGKKNSIGDICQHIENNLLKEALKSVKDRRILGNTGMTQTCLAVCAIALSDEEEVEDWLDWLFDPGFPGEHGGRRDPVPWVMVEGLDRDGMGAECGNYGLIWSRSFIELAEILASYTQYEKHDMVKDYPKLKQCFLVESRLNCLDSVIPPIGDAGSTGSWGRTGSAYLFLRGYRLYKEPEMAVLAWHFAEGDPDLLRLPGDIYMENPEDLGEEVEQAAKDSGDFEIKSEHMGRYGQAVLQTEKKENGRALWIHYGYGKGHSHRDCLNIGLYAKNIDMLPDLGYPEYASAWPKRYAWTSNTISHNTLLVNDTQSGYSPGGMVNLFDVDPPLRVIDVSSERAYEGIESYRRIVALVDISDEDSYVVDIFRARGGKNHRLSYHGPAETNVIDGIQMVKQQVGTFAGNDVEFGAQGHAQSGFSYLYDVERSADSVESYFTVDWKAEDKRGRIEEGKEPHLRIHCLTPCDEVALASGDPPQNKAGNPRRLRYFIQSRLGDEMESQFVSVLEPYDRNPFIKSVRSLSVEHDVDPDSVIALMVELENGRADYIISCEEPTHVRVENNIEFNGRFLLVRTINNNPRLMRMVEGKMLRFGRVMLNYDSEAYRGKVVAVDASDPENHKIYIDPPLPADAEVKGKVIHFYGNQPMDTSYTIKEIGDGYISTGDITIIKGFWNPEDYTSGYKYLVKPGDDYIIPICRGAKAPFSILVR